MADVNLALPVVNRACVFKNITYMGPLVKKYYLAAL